MSAQAIADGFAGLLLREHWHWFCNFTFRPRAETKGGGVHPERADKAFRFWVSCINRDMFGPNWSKRRIAQGGLIWGRGQEFHQDGRIHFHAVMASPTGDLNTQFSRLEAMNLWFREFGIARIYRPESQGDVSGYVSKYVAKGGEVDFSENFGRVRPAPLQLDALGLPVPKPATRPDPATDGEPRRGTVQSGGQFQPSLALALLDPLPMSSESPDDDENESTRDDLN